MEMLIALVIGYVIGVLQGGIRVYEYSEPPETKKQSYNKSYGIDEFKEYYEDTNGANKF